MIKFLLRFFILIFVIVPCVQAETFYSWHSFEVDKCASIWLIKRFIDQNAIIKIFPRGYKLKDAIPFDIPYAKFRRYHNMSTFEFLRKYYKIDDPKVIQLGKIIDDIELTVWEENRFKISKKIKNDVYYFIENYKNDQQIIDFCLQYFDFLYKKITTIKNFEDF